MTPDTAASTPHRSVVMDRLFRWGGLVSLVVSMLAVIAAIDHDDHEYQLGNRHPDDTIYFVIMSVGAALAFASLFWVIYKIFQEQKNLDIEEKAKQEAREQDPEWPDYLRLRDKFYS